MIETFLCKSITFEKESRRERGGGARGLGGMQIWVLAKWQSRVTAWYSGDRSSQWASCYCHLLWHRTSVFTVSFEFKGQSNFSSGSKDFKTGGRGRILRSGVCFDAPSHIPYDFVIRVVNKIHIVNIVCWLNSMCMHVVQSKFTNPPPPIFLTQRPAPGPPALAPPLNLVPK